MTIFREEKGTPLLKESYLAVIQNSVGTNTFRNFYYEIDGVRTDVLRDGDLSCAFYVSSILVLFELINEVHSEVDATIIDMEACGWIRVPEPTAGDVLIWESKQGASGEFHRHMGFYIGNERAVNNSPEKGVPTISHWTFNDTRAVELIFRKEL